MLTINVAKRQINIPVWNFLLISMEIFPIFFFLPAAFGSECYTQNGNFLTVPPQLFPGSVSTELTTFSKFESVKMIKSSDLTKDTRNFGSKKAWRESGVNNIDSSVPECALFSSGVISPRACSTNCCDHFARIRLQFVIIYDFLCKIITELR